MEPLKVSREDFPMSTATADGMIPMQPILDNYEIYYKIGIAFRGKHAVVKKSPA